MTPETAFIFAMSLALLWIKPGPGQALIITRTLNAGFWPGFYVVLGITSGVAIFFLVAVIGLSAITQFFDKAGFIFKILGATYLINIGVNGLKNINSGIWKNKTDELKKTKFLENYPLGLFLTLGNPFVIFYFIGILPTLVPLENMGISDILIGLVLVVVIGLIVDTLIVLLFSQVKMLLSDEKVVRKINLITSVGFILIACFLIYSAFFKSNFAFNLF